MVLTRVLLGSLLVLLVHAESPGSDGEEPGSDHVLLKSDNTTTTPDLSLAAAHTAILALLLQLSQPGNLSQLETTRRSQRQIRFKSSYLELPAGLQGEKGQDTEDLSYFIQVDVVDPPASTALAWLPEGAKTYFPPQLSQLQVPQGKQKDSNNTITKQKAEQVDSFSAGVPGGNQRAAKSLQDTSSRSQIDISPHSEDLSQNTNKFHFVEHMELVTSPSTTTVVTSAREEPTTENPNLIAKGILVSSSYSSYSLSDSQPSKEFTNTQSHPVSSVTPSSTPSYFIESFSSISHPSSESPAPRNKDIPSTSNYSFSTPPSSVSTPSPPRAHSYSSYFTTASPAALPPPVDTTSNSIPIFSSTRSSTLSETNSSTLPLTIPSSFVSQTSETITTFPFLSSKLKSFTKPSRLSLSTTKSFTAPPPTASINSKSLLKNSFTPSKSVSNSYIEAPTSVTFSSFPKTSILTDKGIQKPIHNHSLSLNSDSRAFSPPVSFSSSSIGVPQNSSDLFLLPSSTAQPKRISTRSKVRGKIYSAPARSHIPSSLRLEAQKSKTLTKSLSKHRFRPVQTSYNIVRQQSKSRTNSRSLSHSRTSLSRLVTVPKQNLSRGGGGKDTSRPETPVLDGKTRTVGSSDVPYTGSIPGRGGIDYPILQSIPKTGFECSSKPFGGYFADPETNCQVFHVCWDGRSASFLCPLGTLFSQQLLVCDWWYNVDCSSTHSLIDAAAAIWSPTTHSNYL
ncbi:uncharacterized protein [Cherax quadricarinatus]|uniref:uncharacterized protein n=1 Tax=Cherax quadricarinatus TaxID=27406 RepID=UPI00387E45A0